MEFEIVSATPYRNYSLMNILLSYCNTILNLAEYKPFFPGAVPCCILTIRYYISYVFYQVLLTKVFIFEYSYGHCK